jgi:tetratricopeptide (TPR) repeat protein
MAPGPLTVFAPNDDAFAEVIKALKTTKLGLMELPNLGDILKNHVVAGAIMSSDLKEGQARALQRDSADQAIVFLDGFLKGNPGARDARLNLARLLVSARRYPEARKQFEILVGEAPNNPEIAMAVATVGYLAFGASMALGAFLAGMVVGQSKVSHQAAADA